ncbi:MAG: glycosyltransferase [Candidatus Roizmanbacteria bacterium]|nr:MAG: glycosyltransferase [Candidatus Roizmanbacteria bacterium]
MLNKKNNSITISIITRNRDQSLKRCLISLCQRTIHPKEVLIIDNDSKDNTKKVVNYFSNLLPIRYIHEPKIGIPFARNRALKEAKGEILAFIDDDCEATPNWIEEILKAHKKYPQAAAIQGKNIVKPKNIFTYLHYELYKLWINQNKKKDKLFVLDTKNVSFKLKVIKQAKVKFDPGFSRCSDVDFGKQILFKGLDIVYLPQIITYHWENNVLNLLIKDYAKGLGNAKLRYKWTKEFTESEEKKIKYHNKINSIKVGLPLPQKIFVSFCLKLNRTIFNLGLDYQNQMDILKVSRIKVFNNTVSAAIVTKNRPKSLQKCLMSLVKQTILPKEILIIDSSDDDKTKKLISLFKRQLNLKYIFESKTGISNARNRALKETAGEILAFIDDDCEASPNWIEEIVKAHHKYPQVVAIQGSCSIFPKDDLLSSVSQEEYDIWISNNLKKDNKLFTLDLENSSFKTALLSKLDLSFDPFFTKNYYCEDIDFGKKLLAKKQIIIYYPLIKIGSWRRKSLLSFLKQRFLKGKGRALIDYKWEPAFGLLKINRLIKPLVPQIKLTSIFFRKISWISKTVFQLGENIEKIKILYSRLSYQNPQMISYIIDSLALIKKNSDKKIINKFLYRLIFLFIFRSKKKDFHYNRQQIIENKINKIYVSVAIRTKNINELFKKLVFFSKIKKRPDEVIILTYQKWKFLKDISFIFSPFFRTQFIFVKDLQYKENIKNIINEAQGKILTFIDDDCEATPNWIEEIIKTHQKFPDTAAIQGDIVMRKKELLFPLIIRTIFKLQMKHNSNKDGLLSYINIKNISFKKNHLKDIDLKLDNESPSGALTDVGRQLFLKNKKIIYCPEIRNYIKFTNILKFLKQGYEDGQLQAKLNYDWQGVIPKKPLKPLIEDYQIVVNNMLKALSLSYISKLLSKIFLKIYLVLFKIGFYRMSNFYHMSNKFIFTDNKIFQAYFSRKEDISVAIITHQHDQLLKSCLLSLVKQTIYPKEILIIDNDSTNNTKEVINSFSNVLPIRYIHESVVGIPYARNRALKEATGEILTFIDNDCEASPNWIEKIVKAHKKFPNVAAIQGDILYKSDILSSIILKLFFKMQINHNLIKEKYLSFINIKNISFKTKVVKSLSFDENFLQEYSIDFARQLVLNKQNILYLPQIITNNNQSQSIISFLKESPHKGKEHAKLEYKWCSMLPKKNLFNLLTEHEPYLKTMGKSIHFFYRPILYSIYKIYKELFRQGFLKNKRKALIENLERITLEKNKDLNISIAIITLNRYQSLEKCLFSLAKQSIYPREVLIIDNGSTDNTKKIVDSFSNVLPIRYIYESVSGIPYARNRALKETTGKILAFIDDDCEATSNWIEQIANSHKKFPNASAIQGIAYCKYKDPYSFLSQKYHLNWLHKNLKDNNEISIIDTKNASFKISFINNLNLSFDTNLLRGSDADFAKQIILKGGKIFHDPFIKIYFKPRNSLKSFLDHRFQVGYYNAKLRYKWGKDLNKDLKTSTLSFKYPPDKLIQILILGNLARLYYSLGQVFGNIKKYYDYERLIKITSSPSDYLYKRKKQVKLAVMIITKDRYDSLIKTLISLKNQTMKPDQIIIVNSSVNADIPFMSKFKELPISQVIEKRMGFGIARNTALKKIRTDIIATIDDDEEAPKDWCQKIIETHQEFPEAAAIQGRLICQPERSIYAITEQIKLDRWFLSKINYQNRIYTMSTKNVSFKTAFIRANNLKFKTDDLHGKYGGEDIDFSNQLLSKKLTIIYSPQITVFHQERSSLFSYLSQQSRKGSSRALIKRNWGSFEKTIPKFLSMNYKSKLDILFHPSIKKNIYLLPLIITVYFLSLIAYAKGLKDLEKELKLSPVQSPLSSSKLTAI